MGEGRRVGKANLIGLKNVEKRGFLWVSAGGDAATTSLNRMEGRGEKTDLNGLKELRTRDFFRASE